MQHRGSVAIERALGIASGTGSVAQGRGGPLVKFGPLEVVLLGCEQPLIAREDRQPGFWLAGLLGHQHNPTIDGKIRREALNDRA